MTDVAERFTLTEHWSNSETCLALVGPQLALQQIARNLAVPDEAIVTLLPHRCVLGLWGDALAAYRRMRLTGAGSLVTQIVWAA
jgi:hypothetical protein